ncbi:hypothetical protein ATE84_4848 [Aquimarina sp. MAR_2010_214]|uniref:hypothetical protein n=1 Tax=Aquimarina sp. MAR_2010_214 TaxID=1250026 RepID=UPI000C7111DA|nr:hypothetical protein [Aquimarina sp. MAR_2010_214]PKV52727.1 hypothetical protein ATE84_4848 [Aquimarina sp. MAR_2010_214]
MKRLIYIIVFLFSLGCANNASKSMEMDTVESFEKTEEQSNLSEDDAYTLIITQKLQEYLDKKTLAKTNPDFTTDTNKNELLSTEEGAQLKHIDFITPFETVSDSVQKVVTRVVLEHQTDTIITFIKTSIITIDNEVFRTHKIEFETTENVKN